MPKPTTQAEALALSIKARTAPLTNCLFCDTTAVTHDDFTDEVSRREFRISKLCQKCQDEAFAVPDEEEFDG